MGVDANQVLKEVVSKGKVLLGEKQTKSAIKNQKAKLVVIAKNCPYSSEITKNADDEKIPVFLYQSDNVELGNICGKSYAVSALAILETGETSIMQLVNPKKRK